jgi:hypothetical protein
MHATLAIEPLAFPDAHRPSFRRNIKLTQPTQYGTALEEQPPAQPAMREFPTLGGFVHCLTVDSQHLGDLIRSENLDPLGHR